MGLEDTLCNIQPNRRTLHARLLPVEWNVKTSTLALRCRLGKEPPPSTVAAPFHCRISEKWGDASIPSSRTDELRRDQFHLATQLAEFLRPVLRRPARLHQDQR